MSAEMGTPLFSFTPHLFPHAFMQAPTSLFTLVPSIVTAGTLAWFLVSSLRARTRLEKEMHLLAISERRHRSVIEASPNCIQTLDSGGYCLTINARGLTILGLQQNQVLGQPLISHWPSSMRPVLSAAFDGALRGETKRLDTVYFRPDGEERAINVTFNPIPDLEGGVENVICIAIDITDRKKVEHEAFTARHLAEAATRAKTDFLAVVSHEIRTPLGGMIGMLELLRKQPQNAEQKRYVSLAQESAQMLVELLNDLLDHSKIEAGHLVLEAIPFRPRVELTRAIECLRTRATIKGLAFIYSVADDVPEFLQGDPTRLRQAVGNLLSNAIKFTSVGSVQVEVSNAPPSSADRRGLSIRITDTGPGISAAAQTRLFSKYEQGDASTSRFFGGSGLGLSIVKQIAELMNGEIKVLSQTGQGTTFHLSVQLQVPTQDLIEAISSQPSSVIVPRHTHQLRVLCADDETIHRVIAEGFAKGMGHLIDFANNGEEAVEKLSTGDFDVVLMDSRMPKMDGIEATRRIRNQSTSARDHGIFIAATTADTSSAHREKCFSAGMNRFLVKPFHEADLAALLKDVIECQLARDRVLPAISCVPPSVQDSNPSIAAPAMNEGDILAMLDAAEAVENVSPPPKPEIVLQYLRDAPTRFAQMRAGLKNGDATALAIAAHSIKSISFYVSAHSLCVLGRKIESAADAGQLVEAEALLEKAESEFTEVRRQLTRSTRIHHEVLAR